MPLNEIEAEQICRSAESALRRGSLNLHQFPGLLKRVIDERLWTRRQVPGLGVVELSSLRELVTAEPLRGWGADPAQIEAVIRADADVLRLWRAEMKGKPGRPFKQSADNISHLDTPHGTSRAYTLDRLNRTAPELYQRVVAGELSAHRALILAGKVKVKTPLEQLEHWWARTAPDDRLTFLRRCAFDDHNTRGNKCSNTEGNAHSNEGGNSDG